MSKAKVKKVVARMVENGCSVKEAGREEGYSEAYLTSGKLQKTKDFKEEAKKFFDDLDASAREALNSLRSKVDEAKYAELSQHLERVDKMKRLAEGKSTENTQFTFRWQDGDSDPVQAETPPEELS